MTETPENTPPLDRLDLLAAYFFYELGAPSLQHAPALLMGFRSVARTPLLRDREIELDNLRRACHGLSTVAALKAEAVRYNNASQTAKHQRFFRIDERKLLVQPSFDLIAPELTKALAELKQPHAPNTHRMLMAKTDLANQPMSIQLQYGDESRRYTLHAIPKVVPTPIRHDQTPRVRRDRLSIAWSDLLDNARAMDAIDQQLQVPRPGNWYQRLQAVALHRVDDQGQFHQESQLTLAGLKHLIGLPGAGKTTLLMCLLRHLGKQGLKVVVFFPSIEVCRQYLDDLRRYGVTTGLLVGQSKTTRERHAKKLAEALASDDPLRGFGASTDSAGLFEGVCALPAFTSAPADAFELPHRYCTNISQGTPLQSHKASAKAKPDRQKKHLCPLWSLCGLTRAARELPQANVWLGHIRSVDTRVPRHTTGFDERYFELIARTCDVVIFDEADRAQQDLDQGGVSELSLSGHQQSFHRVVQRGTLEQIASGNNGILEHIDYAQLAFEIAAFEKLNVALMHAVLRLTDELRKEFDGLLMSPLRIIGDWLSPKRLSALADTQDADPQAQAKDALSEFWESAAIAAFQGRSLRSGTFTIPADVVTRAATVFSLEPEQAEALYQDLLHAMSDWLAESSLQELHLIAKRIANLLRDVRRASTDAEAYQLVGLLLPVTFTILSFRRLSPRLNAMIDQGLLEPMRTEQLVSKTLLAATPDNILGSLSGVRFSTKPTPGRTPRGHDTDLQLQYVVFAGTPRLLMYRLHESIKHPDGTRDGPAVLLTSATSYLPPSPAHHVAVTPHYVLQRLAHERMTATASHYAFRPIPDGQGEMASFLRFSGEPTEAQRMANLEKMVLALLDGGPMHAQLTHDCAQFDVVHGIGRRAGFVVNSYEQAQRLKRYIDQRLPAWRDKVIAVVDTLPDQDTSAGFVTASRAERLGDDDRWQVLIFPHAALGRGTNIVFTRGPRQRDAVLGTLYFLTRPHPAPNDMSLPVSMAAKATLDFDLSENDAASLELIGKRVLNARRKAYAHIGQLLRRPLNARALGKLFEPFTANMAVSLLQTIGRAMRNGCPVQCFFVDRAWAEKTARGERDTETSSMLVQLRTLLERGVNSDDPREAALFRALYGAFLDPLSRITGLSTDASPAHHALDDDWHENPLWTSDAPLDDKEL